jgi:hypothetical protein
MTEKYRKVPGCADLADKVHRAAGLADEDHWQGVRRSVETFARTRQVA